MTYPTAKLSPLSHSCLQQLRLALIRHEIFQDHHVHRMERVQHARGTLQYSAIDLIRERALKFKLTLSTLLHLLQCAEEALQLKLLAKIHIIVRMFTVEKHRQWVPFPNEPHS